MRADTIEEIEALIPNLRAYARFLTKDREDADDLVQSCLERALTKQHQFTEGTNLKAWLFTILRNTFLNDQRRARRHRDDIAAEDCEALFPVAASQGSHMALLDFWNAFRELSEEHRSVLALVGAEGLSYEEAASVLAVPVGTVRSRLSRARSALRERGIFPYATGDPDVAGAVRQWASS